MFQQLPTNKKTFMISYGAVNTALLFVLSLLDSLLNFGFGVPGVKMGLSNIVVILSLCNFGFRYSFLIVIAKILINTFFLSGFSSFLFTAMGSMAGFLIMYFLKKILEGKISCIGMSAAGSFFHIVMQYVMSAVIMKTTAVFYMMPYAVILSLVSSVGVGVLCNIILNVKRKEV